MSKEIEGLKMTTNAGEKKAREFLINILTSGTIKKKKYYSAKLLKKAEEVSSNELENGGFVKTIEYSAYEALSKENNRLKMALEFYTDLEKEYLANGGLFNPELMSLTGETLQNIFKVAREALNHQAKDVE